MSSTNTIIGAGPVGMMLALSLRQQGIHPLLVGPAPTSLPGMVYALHPQNLIFLQQLGIRVPQNPINEMRLAYNQSNVEINALFTEKKYLCHIIKHNDLIHALKKACHDHDINWIQSTPSVYTYPHLTINQKRHTVDKIFACDGSQSWTRKHTPIPISTTNYKQFAHTAILSHTHKQIAAFQDFSQQGTLALLPLTNKHQSALIWSCHQSQHQEIQKHGLKHALKALPQFRIAKIEQHCYFPLSSIIANKYYHSNIYLLGNALHTIHPLAGIGLNLAIGDICSLTYMLHHHRSGEEYQLNRQAAHTKAQWLTDTLATNSEISQKMQNPIIKKLLELPIFKKILLDQIDRICVFSQY